MLADILNHVADELDLAGINATADPRDLTLPGVWITPEQITDATLSTAGVTVTVAVVMVASSSTPELAVIDLDELLTAITAWAAAPTSWQAATIRLPNHATEPLPCLRGTVELTVTP